MKMILNYERYDVGRAKQLRLLQQALLSFKCSTNSMQKGDLFKYFENNEIMKK